MTTRTRRAFLAGAAVAGSAVSLRPAAAAEFTYKCGHGQVADHPINLRLNEAAAKTLQDTGGRLDIKIYPSGQLGRDVEMLSQVRLGALEFTCIGDNILAGTVPATAVSGIPFAFDGYVSLWRAMDGEFGKYVRGQVRKVAGVTTFEHGWDVGFRQVCNSLRQIHVADDLKGLKMRVPEAPLTVSLFRALGASPTAIDYKEAYVSIQTHLVDGTELPLASIETAKFYEIQKYVSITNHMGTSYSMLASNDPWAKLPQSLRDITERNFNAAALVERADIAHGDDALTAKLKSQSMVFNNADISTFRAAVRKAGLYAQWRVTYGADAFALLEKSVGKLA